jgi:hypothetical protein
VVAFFVLAVLAAFSRAHYDYLGQRMNLKVGMFDIQTTQKKKKPFFYFYYY